MATKNAGPLVALQGLYTRIDGKDYAISPGDVVDANHPVVKKLPHLFRPQEIRLETPVIEQATAAPGEKRGN